MILSHPSPTDRGPVWSPDTILTCEHCIPSLQLHQILIIIYMYVYTDCVSILEIRDCVNELGNVVEDTLRGGTSYRTVYDKQKPKWKQLA